MEKSEIVSRAGAAAAPPLLEQDFECATGFEDFFEQTPACGTGVASHVFQPEETGEFRSDMYYLLRTDGCRGLLYYIHTRSWRIVREKCHASSKVCASMQLPSFESSF